MRLNTVRPLQPACSSKRGAATVAVVVKSEGSGQLSSQEIIWHDSESDEPHTSGAYAVISTSVFEAAVLYEHSVRDPCYPHTTYMSGHLNLVDFTALK
jgi:hypothetical protein